MTADADAQPVEATKPGRSRRRVAIALIVIASVLAFFAIFALWANRQLLNTDNWARTSSELLEKETIRTQIAGFLVDELYANVDVQSDLEQVFEEVLTPQRAALLAGPASGGLRSLAEDAANRLLQRPRPQTLWEEANRRAQLRLVQAIEGGGDVLSTSGGDVTLDLKALFSQTQSNLGVGGRVEQRLPASASQIVLLQSDQIALAQDVLWVLKALPIVLVVLAVALFALGVYLARGRRREALRACGIGLLFAGAGALVAAVLAGDAVVNELATTDSVRPAAEDAWDVGTSLLREAAGAAIAYGAVIVIAAWLAGPTRWAVATRRQLAPYLREPRWAWGAFGVVVLALLAWAPTPALRQVIPALVLIGLLALGLEALRRQTAREFPDAQRSDSFKGLRAWGARLRARASGAGERTPVPAADPTLEQLEQLGRLRENGVLDASEFERQKARLLAGSSKPEAAT
jgi:Short C-terminal domain